MTNAKWRMTNDPSPFAIRHSPFYEQLQQPPLHVSLRLKERQEETRLRPIARRRLENFGDAIEQRRDRPNY